MDTFGKFPSRVQTVSEQVADHLREIREFLADRQRELADNELYEAEVRQKLEQKKEEKQRTQAIIDSSTPGIEKEIATYKLAVIQSEIAVIETELQRLGREDVENEEESEEARQAFSRAQDEMKKHLN